MMYIPDLMKGQNRTRLPPQGSHFLFAIDYFV